MLECIPVEGDQRVQVIVPAECFAGDQTDSGNKKTCKKACETEPAGQEQQLIFVPE